MKRNKFTLFALFSRYVVSTLFSNRLYFIALFNLTLLNCQTNKPQENPIPVDQVSDSDFQPSLYMTSESHEFLKSKINSQEYAPLLIQLRSIADNYVRTGPPEYKPGSGYDEQLWQRPVGNAIPELAMTYLMTDQEKYFESAKEFMLASASYPTWGIGDIDNADLATGHQLYGMAVGYDWLHNKLDVTSRDIIRNCLKERGARLYNLLLTQDKTVWWREQYFHNHQHVALTGLVAAGLVLSKEDSDAEKWVALGQQKLDKAIASMPDDGGYVEGIPYSEYSITYLTKFMGFNHELLGGDSFEVNDDTFFKNLASFRIYAMLPRNHWNASSTLMTLGDGPRYDWYGPEHFLRKVAAEYNDGYAQWFANEISSSGFSVPSAFFLNLLWVNPEIQPQRPDNLPTFKHFNDLDIAYMRSGWDGNESLSMFKCGTWIGKRGASEYTYDPYGGHTHPDVGTFQIFSHGDWLITSPGYSWGRTIYQNTLVVNGKGQIGEGRWFNGTDYAQASEQPSIVYSHSEEDYDYVIGNAKPAYKSETNLTSYYRHILYLKPDYWIIADEVTASSPSLFDFYFHSDFTFTADGANQFRVNGASASMNAKILKPSDAGKQTFLQDIEDTGVGIAQQLYVLKVSSKDKLGELFITVFDTYAKGSISTVTTSISTFEGSEYLEVRLKNDVKKFRIASDRADKSSPLFIEEE
ncbi:DUF4962 domain-containing protein [Aestuariibaculum suncheonense]|uniref:Heparinase II/III family protein n=1 Tax=Aestuariibaculum suncheonense TaxID=1028745 RepID=A0A8J6Q8V7_9FLAO|nr:DUF4962 domain-containing protein [Aestuariibaculum suncheonense]MBD0835405.1 heparinase II/III family protein [Aestuariibaculum suncheonense]